MTSRTITARPYVYVRRTRARVPAPPKVSVLFRIRSVSQEIVRMGLSHAKPL